MNEKLVELLAIELHDKFMSEEEWIATFGEKKPSWLEEAEHNRDDFRHHAIVAIKFLERNGYMK